MSKGKCYYDKEGKLFKFNNRSNDLQEIYIQKGRNCIWEINGEEYIILLPLSTTLVETQEVIGIENYIGGTCHSKVGVISHGIGDTGTMFGPNFCGHFLISLHNSTDRPLKIKVGKTIVSLVFHYLRTPIDEKNHTDNAHIDKMSSLGVLLSTEETEELNMDWKRNLDDIRTKMNESIEYKEYINQLKKRKFCEIKKYINLRNMIIISVIGTILIFIYLLCYYVDLKNNNYVWTNRFFDVGCSGIIVALIQFAFNLLKRKN